MVSFHVYYEIFYVNRYVDKEPVYGFVGSYNAFYTNPDVDLDSQSDKLSSV